MQNLNRRQFTKSLLGAPALATQAAPVEPQTTMMAAVWQKQAPGIWRASIGTSEEHTPVRSRLIASKATAAITDAASHTPLLRVEGKVTKRGTFLRLPLEADELMYGFGLQLQSFQQRGKKRTIRVNADPKGDSGDSHAPVPFYVTTRGYGILVDSFRNVSFACGNSQPVPASAVDATGLRIDNPGLMRQADRKHAADVRVEVPRASGIDVYYFSGPSMLEAVQRYNMFSGGGVNPPAWGLGFWYRPELHLNSNEVLALMQEFRAKGISCDVFGLEPGWQTHAYSCSFMWNRDLYPDPPGFIQQASAKSFHVNLWEHAFTHPSAPIFEKLHRHAGDYAVFHGLVPDFAAGPARSIFSEYHAKEFVDAGISGFKLDECDNSDFTNGWSWPDFALFPSGLDGEQMHSAFGIRYQHAVRNAFQSRNKDTYGLVRSSGALAAPYPFVLYSDLYDHREFIRGLINCGFSGLLWCPEVRDASSEEDLIRRLQSVIFSSLAMVNAWYIKNPPWKQIDRTKNNEGTLAEDWQSLESRCREIIGWRMSLLPYLMASFTNYAENGLPPFRSPLLDFPEDKSLVTVDDEYMVGDRMLVAPMFAGEEKRTVRLPQGNWHDFWTGALCADSATFDASFTRIPVFVRENSIVPWAEVAPHTGDLGTRRLRMRVYGNGSFGWQGLKREDHEWRSAKGESFHIVSWDEITTHQN